MARNKGDTARGDRARDADDFKNTEDASPSRLFDLRYLIGGLFTLYGVVLTIAGFFTSDQARSKADGININLWMGLIMLATGLFFLGWAWSRPLQVGHVEDGGREADSRRVGTH
jgi:hypothetical protein